MVHADNCYCDKITSLELKTKVSFIMYKKERFLPSNTANLALNCLKNSKVFYRGIEGSPLEESFVEKETYHPLFLYPSEDAKVLSKELLETINKPINLIIPDGTWRQAKKVQSREPILSEVQCVILPETKKSTYPLRRQKFEHGLCTFEAMSVALGIIENSASERVLEENFKLMIDAHLVNRVILEKEKPLV